MWPKSILLVAFFTLALSSASAYKILGIFHTAARSHFIVGGSLMKSLAQQGHEVTVISPFPQKDPLPNYHDVTLDSIGKSMQKEMSVILQMAEQSVLTNMMLVHNMGVRLTKMALEEPKVKELMASNQTFDAVICEVFLSEAMYGLAEHFKAPLIGLGTFGAIIWNTDMVGSPSPPSYVPNAFLPFNDHMTLLERIGNLGYLTFERIYYDLFYFPRQEALYKQHFPHLERPLDDIRKNTAAVLLNQHVSLSFPRPYMPNQIEVGGMHINRKRKPLPADIQKFIDESKHGVIYFSMGSNLKSTVLPLAKREALLNAFRGLKQRVLWKFEDPNMPGKPDNVFISDWFPQDDILAHKNVLAFITHGGLLSTTETIYHGKPIIAIPIFGDQFLNTARAEQNGYGIKVDYKTLTSEGLTSAIERIVSDPSYTKQVQKMSTHYRDQALEPMQLAIHWVEHVARHKGARYLHCAGQDLDFIQYHNIDAILILYGGSTVAFVLIIRLLWYILQVVLVKKDPKVKKQ